MDGADNGSALH
jgi:hypothetical protein